MATVLTPLQLQQMRNLMLGQVSEENKGWYTAWLDENLSDTASHVLRGGNPLDEGFRGLEVRDALVHLGIARVAPR